MVINSKELSLKYYKILIQINEIKVIPAIKIPLLKSILEKEILAKITGVYHFHDKFSNNTVVREGQKKWLLNNKVKDKDRYGTPKSGTIRSDIVSGIINLFDLRNVAEHDDINITEADYLGVFALMAKIINYFFLEPIPDEIKNVCNLKNTEKIKTTIIVRSTKENTSSAVVKNDKEKNEINKLHNRLPKWKKNPNQYNSIILNTFFELEDNDGFVELKTLEKEFKRKTNQNVNFEGNITQMYNYGEKNHGKVFEKIDNKIKLWERIEKYARELFCK